MIASLNGKNIFKPVIRKDLIGRAMNMIKVFALISGMCYNCKVFDKLRLPKGYKKAYIEWFIPSPDESLSEYAHKMAKTIDTSRPFETHMFCFLFQ